MPFLAKDLKQAVFLENLQGYEATIFNRQDLEEETWNLVWQNIESLQSSNPNSEITFHFPVNNSDYVNDLFVRSRLKEALQRASDLGLRGVVVHSNRIHIISEWTNLDLEAERLKVLDVLNNVYEMAATPHTWLALENMPVMDNYAKEIDPLFCYPQDFNQVFDLNIGIVWDVCHYTNTISNIREVVEGKQSQKFYPNFQQVGYLDFMRLKDKIQHWHFSAFKGIANPEEGTHCKEGVLPEASELDESIYTSILNEISQMDNTQRLMVLEIQEIDYTVRHNFKKAFEWIRHNETIFN